MKVIKDFLKRIPFVENIYINSKRKKLIENIKANGYSIMNDASNALSMVNVDYFADYGTLLGFVRDNGFIAHDPDIDISVIYKDKTTLSLVEEALLSAGFRKYLTFLKSGEVVEEAYEKKGIKMDVFYYFTDGDVNRVYSSYTEKIDYEEPFNKTVFCEVHGQFKGVTYFDNGELRFPIPVNYEEWIVERYGETWRTPILSWGLEDSKSIGEITKTYDGQQIVHY